VIGSDALAFACIAESADRPIAQAGRAAPGRRACEASRFNARPAGSVFCWRCRRRAASLRVEAPVPKAVALDHVQLAMPRGQEDAARRFYCGVLGLPEIPKPAHLAARGGVWFQCAWLQLHLGVAEEFRPARKAHPAFVVDDLAALVESLVERGLVVHSDVEQLAGSRRVFTEDPFGNRIELLQPDVPTAP
jgi:catechol 2,3-dioxygenase-like lactoylglutathione lyase family enzyme